MEKLGWFDRFEMAWLDSFLIFQSTGAQQDVIVVYVTDGDYHKLFRARSPLDPTVLSDVITAVLRGGASAVGVDVDTSDKSFQALRTSPGWTAVIWAEGGAPNGDGVFRVEKPLGGRGGVPEGIAAFPIDGDGIVRHYQRMFRADDGLVPSFAWRVVQVFCRERGTKCARSSLQRGSTDRLILHFTSEGQAAGRLSASDVIHAAASAGWGSTQPFKGRIVLIGGSYRAGRDVIASPVGIKPGVSLTADAVRTELGQGPIQPLRDALAFLLDLFIGALIVYIGFRLPPVPALVSILIALPILVAASSFVAFATLAKWVNFVPVVAGMVLHQLYDYGAEYRRLARSLHSGR